MAPARSTLFTIFSGFVVPGIVLLMLIWSPALAAKTAGDDAAVSATTSTSETIYEEPHFYIESIVVEGSTRVSRELLIAESRLETGRIYSERALRRGLEHLNRLPFVLDSAMALQRGTQRGRYVLVLRVTETKAFFYSNDMTHAELSTPLRLDVGELTDRASASNQLTGWRFFVGPYSLISAAIDNELQIHAGWTRYNLADRGILLNVSLSYQSCCPIEFYSLGLDPSFSTWAVDGDRQQARVTLGIPLGSQQSLDVQAAFGVSDDGVRFSALLPDEATEFGEVISIEQAFDDRREVSLGVTWRRDTTDDPLLPTRGSSLSAGLDFRQWSADLQHEELTFDGRASLSRVVVAASRHWPLSRRQSVSIRGRLGLGYSSLRDVLGERGIVDEEGDLFESTLALQHSLELWNAKMQRRFGDLRLENTISWSRDEGPVVDMVAFGPVEQWRFQSSVIFRNAWGIMRLGLTYLEVAERI